MTDLAGKTNPRRPLDTRSALAIFALPGLFLTAVLCYVNLGDNMDFLFNRVIDEYVVVVDIRDMYANLLNHAWLSFIRIRLSTYGFVYVMGSFLFSLPFLLTESIDALVYALRLLSPLFASLCLLALSLTAWRATGQIVAGIFVGIVALSYTGVWILASWIHPDFLMALFVIAATLYAAQLQPDMRKRQLAICALLYALALSSKLQAVMYGAGVVVAIGASGFDGHTIDLRRSVINLAVFGALLLLFYVVLNPNLWSKAGLEQYASQIAIVAQSNSTNHFSFTSVPISL